jgi:hypothetical protein
MVKQLIGLALQSNAAPAALRGLSGRVVQTHRERHV